MTAQTVLWTYIVLLVAGGVMGLVKGRSRISLVVSVSAAALLSLCALDVVPFEFSTWILIALLVVFGWRLYKSRKFMPAGLLLILTALALALPRLI